MISTIWRKTSPISSNFNTTHRNFSSFSTSFSQILHSKLKTHFKSSLNSLVSQKPISNSSISIESHHSNDLKNPNLQLPNNYNDNNNPICLTDTRSGKMKGRMYAILSLLSKLPISQNHQDPNFLSQIDVISVLLSLKNQPLPAFKYFKWVEKQPCFNGGVESLCVLLHILVGPNVHNWKFVTELCSFQKCLNNNNANSVIQGLIDSSKKFDLLLKAHVFNSLFEYFVDDYRLDDAIVCYIAMIDNCGIDLGVKCGVYLLKILIRKNRFKDVDELLDKMKSRGITRDVRIIRGVMRTCFMVRKFEEGEVLFMKARDMGFKLDAKTYRCAIEVVCKNPNSNAAFELLKEMREKGLVPCVWTFIYVVSAFMKQGKMEEALRATDEMISYGNLMNLVVATKLVKGYCEVGDLESAMSLLTNIVKGGVSPNRRIFLLLIKGYCSKGEMEEACKVYELMMQMGVKPSFYMIFLLIKGLLEGQLWEKACEHLKMAVEAGIIQCPSYTFLLSWLCAEGTVDEVRQLWNKIVETDSLSTIVCEKFSCKEKRTVGKRFQPDALTYTILMEGYFKKGEVEKALGIFDEMVRQSIARKDHTYNTIICGLCYNGKTSRARKMLQKFSDENFKPSFTTYNYILHGFIKEDDLNSMVSVYDELSRKGVLGDVTLAKTSVDELRGNKELDKALESLKGIVNEGLEQDVLSYETLIYSACQRKSMNSALKYFSEILHRGLPVHKCVLDCMIKTYRVREEI